MVMSAQRVQAVAAAEAGRAAKDLGLDPLAPVDAFQALRHSGVIVMRHPLGKLSAAYLPAQRTGGPPGVLVNADHPLARQHFSAAHELGHHRRGDDLVLDVSTGWERPAQQGTSTPERLADAFASWFLMPEALVRDQLRGVASISERLGGPDVYQLSLRLRTSYAATVNRLVTLKIVTRDDGERLLKITPQSLKTDLAALDAVKDSRRDVRVVTMPGGDHETLAVQGDALIIEVVETPTSGFRWSTNASPMMLDAIRDDYRPPSDTVIGGAGIRRFVFAAARAGSGVLRFGLSRPWQPMSPADERQLRLTVQAEPAAGLVDPTQLLDPAA